MKYRIIDYPRQIHESFYHEALQSMAARLEKTGVVKSVYQAGGIGSPGISDLDMVVVFEKNVPVDQNFLEGLTSDKKYLFVHNLYGISIDNFREAEKYAFYHTYLLLSGSDAREYPVPDPKEREVLSIQIAFEYILKLYINLFIQEEYRVLRLRDLLLHVKALQYDLDLLRVTGGALYDGVMQILEWRKSWFSKRPDPAEIIKWWELFYQELTAFTHSLFQTKTLFLPPLEKFQIAKNIFLIPSVSGLKASRKGLLIPTFFSAVGKKYFRLLNRMNRFDFEIPVTSQNIPPVIENKFSFEKRIVTYNKNYLPHFLPLTSSLHFNT